MALPSSANLSVLPGSSVTVIATIDTGLDVLSVPPTAIRLANDGAASVMRFVPGDGEEGTLEEVPVTIDASRNGAIVVLDGIAPGDLIVRTGAHAVADGDQVRRFSGYPN